MVPPGSGMFGGGSHSVVPFSGFPAAGFDESVMWRAAEGEAVDVGAAAGGPFVDMVDFTEVAGHVAAGGCAATVFGVQHDSLVG